MSLQHSPTLPKCSNRLALRASKEDINHFSLADNGSRGSNESLLSIVSDRSDINRVQNHEEDGKLDQTVIYKDQAEGISEKNPDYKSTEAKVQERITNIQQELNEKLKEMQHQSRKNIYETQAQLAQNLKKSLEQSVNKQLEQSNQDALMDNQRIIYEAMEEIQEDNVKRANESRREMTELIARITKSLREELRVAETDPEDKSNKSSNNLVIQTQTSPTNTGNTPQSTNEVTGYNQAILRDQAINTREINYPFLKYDPELWFYNLETQFQIRQIHNEEIKVWTVIHNIGNEIRAIKDSIRNLPTQNKYNKLKEIIIGKFSKSEDQKLDELFNNAELGDSTPSELFNHLINLSQGLVSRKAVFAKWRQCLPKSMQFHLLEEYSENTEDKMLQKADKIYKLIPPEESKNVHEVSEQTSNTEIQEMIEKIVNKHIGDFKKRRAENSRSKSRSNSRSRERFKRLCFFHRRFGDRAYACGGNCNWKGKLATKSKQEADNKKPEQILKKEKEEAEVKQEKN